MFVPGFFSAAFAKAATGPIDTRLGGYPAAGTVATAVVGGTASRISGGKFANGAVTAAFGYLFNNQLSKAEAEYFAERASQDVPPLAAPVGRIAQLIRGLAIGVRALFGIQSTTLTVDELVSGSTFLKESKELLQLQRSGGFTEANRVFDVGSKKWTPATLI